MNIGPQLNRDMIEYMNKKLMALGYDGTNAAELLADERGATMGSDPALGEMLEGMESAHIPDHGGVDARLARIESELQRLADHLEALRRLVEEGTAITVQEENPDA